MAHILRYHAKITVWQKKKYQKCGYKAPVLKLSCILFHLSHFSALIKKINDHHPSTCRKTYLGFITISALAFDIGDISLVPETFFKVLGDFYKQKGTWFS